MKEEWKPIQGYEGKYWISNTGKVRNFEKELKQHPVSKNRKYNAVTLYKNGRESKKQFRTHRLVALHFVHNPNPEEYDQVNHIDGNTFNNNYTNLEWCDASMNIQHAFDNNLIDKNKIHFKKENAIKSSFHNCNKASLIVQFDEKYDVVDIQNGVNKFNTSKSSILKNCNLQTSYGGEYKWRYLRDCLIPKKIICICGKSGSGKNYILSNLLENMTDLNNIISYTTRPKRSGECDGVDYNFIEYNDMIERAKNIEFVNTKEYNTALGEWYYASSLNSIDFDKNNIVILDIEGIENYIYKFGRQNLYIIYIEASKEIRKQRYIQRDNNYDEIEMNRRFEKDDVDFPDDKIEELSDIIYNNNYENNINDLIYDIKSNYHNNVSFITPLKYNEKEIEYNNKWYNSLKDWYEDNIFYLSYPTIQNLFYKQHIPLKTLLFLDNKKHQGYQMSNSDKILRDKKSNDILINVREYVDKYKPNKKNILTTEQVCKIDNNIEIINLQQVIYYI